MFSTRNAVNWALITAGLMEPQVRQNSFHPDFFDLAALPLPSPHHKASPVPRDPATLDQITVHVTGVRGGFGTSVSQRTAWDKRMDSNGNLWLPLSMVDLGRQLEVAGVLRQPITPYYEPGRGYAFQMLDDPQLVARRLALWQRFRSVPYHQIAVRAGDVLANRDLAQRSYHGNGGNVGAGYALDMHPSETPDDDFLETGRHGLRMLAMRMAMHRKPGAPPIVVKVTSHRQHKHPGRAQDPGRWAALNVVVPVVKERDDLVIAHGLTTGSGKPWPVDWDPASPYDMKGRRIDGR